MKINLSFIQRRYLGITAVFLSLVLLILVINTASAVDITPGNPQGWAFGLESGTNGSGQFVTGPATPPAGNGSAQLVVTNADTGSGLGIQAYGGTRLADITSMNYWAYRTGGAAATAVTLQLNIDLNLADADDSYQGRLVYEPGNNGAHSTGVWEQWDVIDSGNALWWATNPAGAISGCTIGTPCTLSAWLLAFPEMGINTNPLYEGLGFKVGSGWANFDGNVDDFNITISGVTDTYNFENLPVNNITQNTGHPTIQDGVDNAIAGDVIVVDPGTYSENVVVDKSLTLRGAGAGVNPLVHTILDGTSLGAGSGIQLLVSVTNVTIEDLTAQNYSMSNSSQAGIAGAGSNDNFTVQNVSALNNTGGRGGIYLNGPVDTVLIDTVTAHDNQGRGIVIWNGSKTNITITNNDARRNDCCGIELQDGTASGVTMSGNTAVDNTDSGMSAMGLTSGAGANVIAGNTVTNNGRFGIEIKNPDGTGATSGDGSIVVENNNVSFAASAGMSVRDHGGIVIFRRDFYTAMGYVDIPTGVVVRNNTVLGYAQQNPAATTSEGFGIVVEGVNHTVTGNTLQNNEIGIQEQGGQHPNANYVPNAAGNGDQDDGQSFEYFGRGNAPTACRSTVSGNTFSGNTTDSRVRAATSGSSLVTNADTSEQFCTIQTAVDDTDTLDGHTLQLAADTYTENVHITKDLTISGDSAATTTINPAQNTGTSGDARGWWLVDNGVVLHLSNMTFDGSGYLIWNAVRHNGSGSFTDVDFTEIKYNESGPTYSGLAVRAQGDAPINFTNVTMSEIGRIGVHYGSTGVNGSVVDNLTYTGKGSGDFLDYGVEVGWGAQVTIQNSQFSAIHGVASSDGSDSACVYATTYFAAGTEATIINSDFSDCSTAVYLGYDTSDTTVLTAKGNTIDNVGNVFATTSASNNLTAYANNISNFTDGGLDGALGTINGRHNWWGTHATQPTGVDNDSWAYRLGASVGSWADGSGSATLPDTAALTGSGGTAVLVSHGRPTLPANAPFGKAIAADIGVNQCSDFYDAFVIGGSGSYMLTIPVDAGVDCASGQIGDKLFQFDLIAATGAPNADFCSGTACWHSITAVRTGDLLEKSIDALDLVGTPFVAPSKNSNDPTAVSLQHFNAAAPTAWPYAILLIISIITGVLYWKRKET